jgi:hypothetical protein
MVQVIAGLLAAFGAFLLLRSLWLRTGLSPRQTALTLIAVALVIALIALAATGRLNWIVPAVAAMLPFARRLTRLLNLFPMLRSWLGRRAPNFGRGGSAAAAGAATSTTESAYFRMTLHHASGRMDGEIKQGRHQGQFLSELSLADLRGLLAVLDDFDSGRLLESYLDRAHPQWRQQPDGEVPSGAGAMNRAEALDILGLADGASRDEIVAAHRRLMQRLHPDRGGSTFLAARINEARRRLIG